MKNKDILNKSLLNTSTYDEKHIFNKQQYVLYVSLSDYCNLYGNSSNEGFFRLMQPSIMKN